MTPTEHNWFTIHQIDASTYAISEYGHWECPHVYLIIGKEKAALIDTGTGIGNLRHEVEKLTNLPILVITTHCHWDHIGGHAQFHQIAIHKDDQNWLESGLPIPHSIVVKNLMKDPFTLPAPANFSPEQYQVFKGKADLVLDDGDDIELGGRTLRILHTPGHSPGHICIYERASGSLFTGDILYEGTIYANYPSTDPQAICTSIRKLMALSDIKKLYPGHNQLEIPLKRLTDFSDLCESLLQNDLLKHGTGLHTAEGISLLL